MYNYIIVDDEAIIRKGLITKVNNIKSIDINCVGEAGNGIEGLKLIEEMNPDIIITDMKMARMDGMEFLETISHKYPKKPVIVISGYKKFDYLSKAIEKRAIGYILKPFSKEELLEKFKKAIHVIEEEKRLLKLKKQVEFFEKKKEKDMLCRLILEPWNRISEEVIKKDYNLESYNLLLTVNTKDEKATKIAYEVCENNLSDIQYYILNNITNKNQFFIILSVTQKNKKEKVLIKADHIAKHLKSQFKTRKNFFCISKVLYGFSELNKSYVQNNEMLKEIKLCDENNIFYGSEYTKKYPKQKKDIYPPEYINNIFTNLKHMDYQIKKALFEFFDGINVKQYSLRDIGETCKCLIQKGNEYALQKGVQHNEIIESNKMMEYFYKRYLFCKDVEAMKNEISRYLMMLLESDKELDVEEDLFEMIEEYIRRNYNKKLTIQFIASNFFITPTKCSNILKENLNKTFNEYITDIRIEKSKELLVGTDLSIKSVSNEIGYSNPKYFFRVFKKETACTPLQYRNGKHVKIQAL